VLDAFFLVSQEVSIPVIEQFAKLNNLDGATVKVWFNYKRERDTGEPSEASFACTTYAEYNKPGNICLHFSCFHFCFLRQMRLQPRDDIDE